MRVRWKYNRLGHVEIWDEANQTPREGDIYLQTEDDVNAFFNHIGQDISEVMIDDWDHAEIEPEWFGDEYMLKKEAEKAQANEIAVHRAHENREIIRLEKGIRRNEKGFLHDLTGQDEEDYNEQ